LKDFDENPSLNFKMGQLACESRSISGKYERLLKLFFKSKKDRSPMKIDQFLNLKWGRSLVKIDKFQGSMDIC